MKKFWSVDNDLFELLLSSFGVHFSVNENKDLILSDADASRALYIL